MLFYACHLLPSPRTDYGRSSRRWQLEMSTQPPFRLSFFSCPLFELRLQNVLEDQPRPRRFDLSVAALPSRLLSTRDDNQCDAGTNIYTCGSNDFRGCCSVDPCDLPGGCLDDVENDKPSLPARPAQLSKSFPPRQEKIFPKDGGEPYFSSNFELSASSETSSSRQTTTFYAPPEVVAAGGNCEVRWYVENILSRNFTVEGINGIVNLYDIDAGDRIGQTAMQNWDDEDFPEAHDIKGGGLPCKEVMNIEFRYAQP